MSFGVLSAALVMQLGSCTGSWVNFGEGFDWDRNVGLAVQVTADNRYLMKFSDYGAASGRTSLDFDRALRLHDQDGGFVMRGCETGTPTLKFSDGRTFTLTRLDDSEEGFDLDEAFFELAMKYGWQVEPEGEDYEQPAPSYRADLPGWLISHSPDYPGRCLAHRKGQSPRDFFIRLERVNAQYNSVAMIVDPNEQMSRLRATTTARLSGGFATFDGDVSLPLDLERFGRLYAATNGQSVSYPSSSAYNRTSEQLLDFLARANSVTIHIPGRRAETFNLSGSARAIAALRECAIQTSQ